MDSGVARRPIADLRRYARDLSGRLDPTAGALDAIMESVRANPKRVVFAEGEEEKTVRAAVAFRNAGYGTPGADRARGPRAGDDGQPGSRPGRRASRSTTPGCPATTAKYIEFLYERLQRRGFLQRDCQRMVNQDRNVFAACMVATGDADAMVTGLTRSTVGLPGRHRAGDRSGAGRHRLRPDADAGHRAARTIFIADTLMHFRPDAEQLADIA